MYRKWTCLCFQVSGDKYAHGFLYGNGVRVRRWTLWLHLQEWTGKNSALSSVWYIDWRPIRWSCTVHSQQLRILWFALTQNNTWSSVSGFPHSFLFFFWIPLDLREKEQKNVIFLIFWVKHKSKEFPFTCKSGSKLCEYLNKLHHIFFVMRKLKHLDLKRSLVSSRN